MPPPQRSRSSSLSRRKSAKTKTRREASRSAATWSSSTCSLQSPSGEQSGKVGRLIAECQIVPNKLYFVTLSSIYNADANFTEFRLAINGKTEASQSANEGIRIDPNHVVVGSEVTSSNFTGLLSDLLILTIPFDLAKQKEFYENYWDYQNGTRGRELLDDQLVYAKVEEKYRQSGCPKELLKSYKYDESYKRTVQEKRNYKEVVETEQEIKAKTDKSKAAKLQREKREKKIKENVNSLIRDIRATKPEYFGLLRDFVSSRKWIFKSLNLYSPTIKKAGEAILPFPCAHNLLSKVKDLQVPFYVIEMEHFYKVFNMVRELNNETKKLLVEFANITDTMIEEKKMGPCIVYDKYLHYLCWAEDLRPEGWHEKVEEDNEEEEEEDMSSSEEDPAALVKDDKPKEPLTDFSENAFIGDRQGLKEKLKVFMHELNETAEEETGDIPKMYYENRRLHSFEVFHDTQRVQSLIFNYFVRLDEKTPWEDVMNDYETNGSDPTAVEETGGKGKEDKAAPKGEGGKKVVPTLYKIEQVKCFQEKLPDEEGGKKDDKTKEEPKEGEAKKFRYKFADPKLLTRSIFRMHECNKLVFKTCDNKVFTIRILKKDGSTYRLELQKNMSEEFQVKRQQRLDEIERAKQELAKQVEEENKREREKKEREQKERRERRENRKNKEVFVNTSQVEEEKPVEVKKIEIPELGEFDHVKYTWMPSANPTNFAMAIINEDNQLIGTLALTQASASTRTTTKQSRCTTPSPSKKSPSTTSETSSSTTPNTLLEKPTISESATSSSSTPKKSSSKSSSESRRNVTPANRSRRRDSVVLRHPRRKGSSEARSRTRRREAQERRRGEEGQAARRSRTPQSRPSKSLSSQRRNQDAGREGLRRSPHLRVRLRPRRDRSPAQNRRDRPAQAQQSQGRRQRREGRRQGRRRSCQAQRRQGGRQEQAGRQGQRQGQARGQERRPGPAHGDRPQAHPEDQSRPQVRPGLQNAVPL